MFTQIITISLLKKGQKRDSLPLTPSRKQPHKKLSVAKESEGDQNPNRAIYDDDEEDSEDKGSEDKGSEDKEAGKGKKGAQKVTEKLSGNQAYSDLSIWASLGRE